MEYSPRFRHLMLALLLVQSPTDLSAQHSQVFPQPQSIEIKDGLPPFQIKVSLGYNAFFPDADLIKLLDKRFGEDFHLFLSREFDEPGLVLTKDEAMEPEEYSLQVETKRIVIHSNSREGFLNAYSTLQQLIGNQHTEISIPCVSISDKPAFSYRGVHLDCARHFFTIEEIKGFLDEMALLKFNRFHWHLTDDQGWRIEIKKYPLLTDIGAWRNATLVGHFSNTPHRYDKVAYGGYYTQEEAKEIVNYAATRGIVVVPEIEMPGHARAALAAYPELGCTGKKMPVEGLWGVFDDIFCSKPETRQFLKDVLDEVMTVFPSEVIHIGGDEAPKVRWDVCPHCAKIKTEKGLHDSHELQSFFIQDIENHVRSKGRKIIGWDEILEGGLAQNAQVMSWRGEEGGIEAAKQGHQVVMTPTSFCYFDYYQSGDPGEPLAIGGFLPLEKVYSFNPVPEQLSENERQFILGGQANLWTEYLPQMKDVQYQAFPRLTAMAEVLWTGKTTSYPDFVNALTLHYLPALEKRGVNYSRSFLYPKLEPKATDNGIKYIVEYPAGKDSQKELEINLLRVVNPETINQEIVIAKTAGGTEVSRTYSFTVHSLVGIPVEFITKPDPKYNNHGNLALTDGIVGARPWKGDQWLGFSNDTVQFIIDLGSNKTLGTLSLGTLNDPGSWVYSPKKIVVEGSGDGKVFTRLTDQKISRELIAVEFKSKARFLRITLVNDELVPAGNSGAGNTPWTFIDELILKP